MQKCESALACHAARGVLHIRGFTAKVAEKLAAGSKAMSLIAVGDLAAHRVLLALRPAS